MKKTNSKTTSPAPATSSAPKPAKKKTAAKATPAAVPLTSAPAANPVPASSPAKASTSAPTIKVVAPVTAPKAAATGEPKAIAPSKVQTKIVAKVDVGFGNALYVRGDGPGLNWSHGVPMQCVGSDLWELTLGESSRPISFKVLINDATWCTGPDSIVASGSTSTITPEFA